MGRCVGGFSNYLTRPQDEVTAISDCLCNHISKQKVAYVESFFNNTGCGFPDVSVKRIIAGWAEF